MEGPIAPAALARPALAGLSLPRLTSIPTAYAVNTEVAEGARLAQAFLGASILEAADYQTGDDPASLITRGLERLVLTELQGIDLYVTLAKREEAYRLLVHVEPGRSLDFTLAAQRLDRVHPHLGPSLLHYVGLHTPLTPAFTPEVCRDHIEWLHWGGWEDAEELLDQARQDLAYSREVDADLLCEAEVLEYADSHYFTPNRVNALLDPRYGQPQVLPLEEVERLCRRHSLHNTLQATRCLMTLRKLEKAMPEGDRHSDDEGDGYPPFGALISLALGADTDLVGETFEEYAQMVWQSGEFNPVYTLAFDPADPLSLVKLKAALTTSKRILEATHALFDALEVISWLFP